MSSMSFKYPVARFLVVQVFLDNKVFESPIRLTRHLDAVASERHFVVSRKPRLRPSKCQYIEEFFLAKESMLCLYFSFFLGLHSIRI